MTGKSEVNPRDMMVGIENVGKGWWPIIRALEADLDKIDPDYELQQVKEKFGGLRYYASTKVATFDALHARIAEAEAEADLTCEVCGTTEEVTTEGPRWIKTLCAKDREAHRKRMAER